MADKYPAADGNWSTAANWNGGTKPVAGDVVYADGKSVTIDEDATVASVRTTQRDGGTAGGRFYLSDGITLTADVIAGTTYCVTYEGSTSAAIVGDVTGSATASGTMSAVFHTGSGALTITGDVTGGSIANAYGVYNYSAAGAMIIVGNVTAGSANSTYGVRNRDGATLTVTGNVTGGSGGTLAVGMLNGSTGAVTITGNVTGGSAETSYGVYQSAAGLVTINGDVTGGTHATAYGIFNGFAACTVLVAGDLTAATAPAYWGDLVGSVLRHSIGTATAAASGLQAIAGNGLYLVHATNLVDHVYRSDDAGSPGAERLLSTALSPAEIAAAVWDDVLSPSRTLTE